MALVIRMALTTREGINMDTASSGNKGKALHVCIGGWSKETCIYQ